MSLRILGPGLLLKIRRAIHDLQASSDVRSDSGRDRVCGSI